MILYPAIDLKDGKCVRLYQGDFDKTTIFNDSPADQASKFAMEGAEYIHLVDLNGALQGRSVNIEPVKSILKAISIPAQLGGGIRTIENIETWLTLGISRVILGTVATKDPELVITACKKFPGRIAVGIDAKNGKVAVEGWYKESDISVIELAKKFENAGVAAIIYTDISKDGTMTGADFEGTADLAKSISIPVIASGGISSLDDLRKIKALEKNGVAGVISGRALYEKAFTIKQALSIL
ncbi:MAG TPA: 1-(5-phosphoribosyl)-5-((5-phosphoribosylamino)methylideneamino)imidazole-4-carboxamide isomerase [Alphaproteobacteria bacterium]|nr:1-(5-phosphoribosyl)-5-((5-phosphoribosylamino)methylideneamino)imidazole-4-carboxamide isomerase [Alphaproteobacteria bacterium]